MYTATQESKYLIIKNITKHLALKPEVERFVMKKLSETVSEELDEVIETSFYLDNPDIFTEDEVKQGIHFHDAVVIKFRNIMHALLAKRKCDGQAFYGRELLVGYAPDLETVDELREKLEWRR